MPWPLRMPARCAGVTMAVAVVMALLLAGVRAWDLDRMSAAAQRLGPNATAGVKALQTLLPTLQGQPVASQLQAINEFYNRRVAFRDDMTVWGRNDFWATPLEMLGRGAGDCEDYAIAKYLTLVGIGVPAPQLRLVYVRARIGGPGGPEQAHMVLAWYAAPDAEPQILDNLVTEIRPSSRRQDLQPVFSFNAEGLWQGTAGASAGDPSARLSQWRDVLQRARQEGAL
jgi:predicted transglutaminase-like cysteine proteinase